MKLNCGPDSVLKAVQRELLLVNWHPFFALWPRRVGLNDCRWMETIYRKGTWHDADGYDFGDDWSGWMWDYMSVEQYNKEFAGSV